MQSNTGHDHRDLTLYDETIQELYGVGLKLEYCITLVDESPDQAKHGLDAAIFRLNALIGELRDRINELK